MKRNSNRWSMVFLAVLACVVWAQAPAALAARNERFNEVCSGTVSTADFSFDGSEQAGQYTAECITNIDGPGLKSGLSQNVATATGSCTAPDGTVGTPIQSVATIRRYDIYQERGTNLLYLRQRR